MASKRGWQPPRIPARRHGWERDFVAVMERHLALPFSWKQSHCLLVPADLCKAMCGVDPMRGLRGVSTESGAMRTLVKLGFTDVEMALEAVFADIEPTYVRRGDCGVLEQLVDGKPWLATVIVMGDRAVGKGPRGNVVVETARLKRTFAIGAR